MKLSNQQAQMLLQVLSDSLRMDLGKFFSYPHVAEEYALGKRVSTVWLGNNLNFYGGKPLIFETMIFNEKDEDIYCDRYTTWAQAEKGHQKAVQWVKDGCKNECE